MALFLVQHGKSMPKELDPEQGLSRQGVLDVERIASVAKGYNVRVSVIRHSGKKRARETAEIFAAALDPPEDMEPIDGIAPLDDVAAFADRINAAGDVMLVGHLPFMERLASYLVAGTPDITVIKFQNGGIVCLDKDGEMPGWFIKWTLMPKIG